MTQFFPTIYRQIISLIIHCITIPVGQIRLSFWLIDIIWVKWRPTFKLSAYLLDIMGKSKEISQDVRKRWDECTLVRKVQINPRTTAKVLVKMLEETGIKVSVSTVKRVLYRHNFTCGKGRRLQAEEHHPNHEARWWQHHVVGLLCCRRDWSTSQNRWHHEKIIMWIYWSNISRHQLKLGCKRVFQMDSDTKHTSKVVAKLA